jgi:hypothetical protein
MLGNQAYLWPLAAVASAAFAVAMLRCLTLFIGLFLALRGAPKKDWFAIYREFCQALSFESRSKDTGMELLQRRSSEDGSQRWREPTGGAATDE